MKPMIKITFTLAIVCTLAAAGLAAVNQVTQKAIKENSQKELQESLVKIFPAAEHFESVSLPTPSAGNLKEGKDFSLLELYQAKKGDNKIGYVFKVGTQGYGGQITLLIAISTQDQKMIGMKILEHQETPGLGSEITSSRFLNQFLEKPLTDPYQLNQDIQALSGATISSKAIVRACQGVLTFLKEGANQ